MSRKATVYVSAVIITGLFVLLLTAAMVSSLSVLDVVVLVLSVALAGVKVRFPGVEGTCSLGFALSLAGMGSGMGVEVCAVAALSSAAQSILRTSKRPTWYQIAFNCGAVAISTACCYVAFQSVHTTVAWWAALAGAAAILYASNSMLVGTILVLTGGATVRKALRWQMSLIPVYAAGTLAATALAATTR